MLGSVDEVTDRLGVPFDGVAVVIGRDDRSVAVRERSVAGIPRAVHRRAGTRWLAPLVLHDVQLTAGRPTDGADVVAEQPERRPESLPGRELDTRFHSARRDRHLAARRDLRGLIETAPVVTRNGVGCDAGGDDELAQAVLRDVGGIRGVIL